MLRSSKQPYFREKETARIPMLKAFESWKYLLNPGKTTIMLTK
jgi:hypothetical protein